MDWFSWLSKTSLDPSLVREYALDFADTELEEDDIAHFNHKFLQSMGISIAKHRLEILKLARKRKRRGVQPISRLLFAIKRTNKILGKYIRKWIHRDNSALVIVPKRSNSMRWKGVMLKRNKRLMVGKLGRLMITSGPSYASGNYLDNNTISSPMLQELEDTEKIEDGYHQSSCYEEMEVESYGDHGYLSNGFEEIRWDEMFKDLRPT